MPDPVAAAEAAALQEAQRLLRDNIVSPLMVAATLSTVLLGIGLSLSWRYFSKFPTDRLLFRVFVGLLTFAAVGDTVSTSWWMYSSTISNFANPVALASWPPWFSSYAFYTGPIVACCQIFFVWRCWIVSGQTSYILSSFNLLIAISAVGCTLYLGIWSVTKAKYLSDFQDVAGVAWAFLGLELAGDFLISGGLIWHCYLAPKHKTSLSLLNSSSPLVRLIMQTVTSNSVSLILQSLVLALMVYSFQRNSLHYLIPGFLESKTYIISVIACLNARTLTSSLTTRTNPTYPSNPKIPSNQFSTRFDSLNRHGSRRGTPKEVFTVVNEGEAEYGGEYEPKETVLEMEGVSRMDEGDRGKGRRW